MKKAHRSEKFASTLKHTLAEILLYEMDNPLLKSVSVVQVQVSGDLKNARVLVSSFLPGEEDVLAELDKARNLIKGSLAKKMVLRYIPELVFVRDSGFAMNETLNRLSKETKHG